MPPVKPRRRAISAGDPFSNAEKFDATSAFDEAAGGLDAARDDIGDKFDKFDAEAMSADVELSGDAAYDPSALPSRAEIARIRAMRGTRIGVFAQKLALPKRPGYYRHWFNGEAGRVETARKNGWSHVLDAGKPVHRPVGMGRDNGVLYAYAMEIPEVFWREDMKSRHDEATGRMKQLKANPFKAPAGASDRSDSQKFYSPHESGEVIENS